MASRENDKAMAGLLRRTLARDAGVARDCPEPDILAAYDERSLSADEVARYDLHFSQCARCRQQLAAMARTEEKPRPKTYQVWLLDWRWLVPAAVALVFLIVWVGRRSTTSNMTNRSSNAPLVVMSRTEPLPRSAPSSTEKYEMSRVAPSLPADTSSSKGEVSSSAPGKTQDLRRPGLPTLTQSNEVARGASSRSAKPLVPSTLSGGVGGGVASGQASALRALDKERPEPLARVAPTTAAAPATPPTVPKQVATTAVQVDVVHTPEPAENKKLPAPQQAQRAQLSVAQQPTRTQGQLHQWQQAEVNQKTEAAQTLPLQGRDVQSSEATIDNQGQAPIQTNARNTADLLKLSGRSSETVIPTPDPKVLWRIAQAGFVERTEDGGATWQGQLPDPNAQLMAGAAPSTNVCWFAGRDGKILLTKDSKNWKRVPPPTTADFTAIAAKDASSATVTTSDGRQFSTTNTGRSWKLVQ